MDLGTLASLHKLAFIYCSNTYDKGEIKGVMIANGDILSVAKMTGESPSSH